jgi:hypothetical protein
LSLVIFYVAKDAAFVMAGAKTAPRSRLATAIVLAVANIVISINVNVSRQPGAGVTNYTHLAAESAGAALGVAYIFYSEKSKGTSQ